MFFTFLVFVVPVLHAILHGVRGSWFQVAGASGGITIAVGVVVAYIPSHLIFKSLRWETFEYDGSYCLECNYNLTGNVSGICPECGRPVANASADSRSI